MSMLPSRQRPHRRLRASVVGAVAATLAVAAAAAETASAAAPPSGYRVSTVLTGLDHPWDVDFTPSGNMVFTERAGRINLLRSGRRTVLKTPRDMVANGEGGMMGLTVDPHFRRNRYLYTCFMSDRSAGIDVRVVRWKVRADWAGMVTRRDLVTGIPTNPGSQLGRHSGCRLAFGPDGYLWVTTGDAAVGTNSQNPRSLAGKVLRIRRDGTAPPGNAGSPFRVQIYAFGFRNPQGLSFRPTDGKPFIIEHGPSCDDEITPLARRGNGGWDPEVPGDPLGYDESVPMTDTSRFPRALRPAWRSGCPTIAPSGGTFVTDNRWGLFDNALVVAVLKAEHLRVQRIGPSNQSGAGTIILTGRGRLRTAVEGPHGALYVLTDANPGAILRVVPIPG